MPVHIDLRRLAELNAPDRSFVSLYLTGARALDNLERRIRTTRKLLVNDDEHTYFNENMALIEGYLEDDPPSGPIVIFACWALDLIEAYPLEVPLKEDLLWVDSSPYIRPHAELQAEYENFAVIAADNTQASVHLVTSLKRKDDVRVTGNVKNHVKVGGWSQQRYQRRREKQLKNYADDVVLALRELKRQHAFRRILMVGSRETLAEIRRVMPRALEEPVFADRSIDLSTHTSGRVEQKHHVDKTGIQGRIDSNSLANCYAFADIEVSGKRSRVDAVRLRRRRRKQDCKR